MNNGWTSQRKERQSKLIQQWKPWNQSTGAKTQKGQSISKMNAYKHGARSADLRRLSKQLADWKRQLNKIINFI